jgi:hypothetical protein
MRFFPLCLLAISLPAAAQRLPNASAEPPLDAASLFDDGSSLDGNPGGLGFVRGLEFDWLHDSGFTSGQQRSEGFLLTGGLGGFTLGAGLDFLRRSADFAGSIPCRTEVCPLAILATQGNASFRRLSLGTGFQLGQLGIGATYRSTSGADPFQRDASLDVGAVLRPLRFLALGVAAFDVNAPTQAQPRRWDLSIGIKPLSTVSSAFRDLELAGDLRWSECPNAILGACGFDNKEWFVTLAAPVVRGVRVLGQLGLLENSQTSALVGLQFDLGHIGATYAARFQPGAAEQLWRLRLSSERWESIDGKPAHAVEINLKTAQAGAACDPHRRHH